MKNFLSILVLFSALILQTTFVAAINFFQAAPNLVFAAVFLIFYIETVEYSASGAERSFLKGLFFASLAGLLGDIFSAQPFGALSIGFPLAFLAMFFLLEKIFDKKEAKSVFPAVFAGTFVYNLAALSVFKIADDSFTFASLLFNLWRFVFWEAVLNALLVLVLVKLSQIFFQSWFVKKRLSF